MDGEAISNCYMFKKARSTIIIILITLIAIIIIIKVFDKRIEKIEMKEGG